MGGQIWEVVGGEDKGGIIVRESKELKSPAKDTRLSFGALIEELALAEDRLQFKRLTGSGPDEGWVSLYIKGKYLARRTDRVPEPKHPKWDPYAVLGITPNATDAMIKSAFRKASVRVHLDHSPDDPDTARRLQELTRANEFLRLVHSRQNNVIEPTVNQIWWSDWDEIFDELVAEDEDTEHQERPAPSLRESRVDVLIMGATGFAGSLACMLMQKQHIRTWAIAGRDGRKLDRIRERFGSGWGFRGSTCIETPDDLEALAKTARVSIDFRGPLFQVGSEFGELCVRAGTHYLMLSGDIHFQKTFREKVHTAASANGVCVSSGVGIFSCLQDFNVWNIVRHIREKYGLPTRRVDKYEFSVGQMRSGSMIATGLFRDHKEMQKVMEEGGGAFFLGGKRSCGIREDEKDKIRPYQDPYSGLWAMPVETPCRHYVRCSCSMFDATAPYGDEFLFIDHSLFKNRVEAEDSLTKAEWAKRFYQRSIDQKKIPPQGCGPNERLRQECFTTILLVAEAEDAKEKKEPHKVHSIMRAGPGGMGDRFEGGATLALECGMCILDAIDADLEIRPGWGTPTWHLAHLGFWERILGKGVTYKIVDKGPERYLFKNLMASTLPLGETLED